MRRRGYAPRSAAPERTGGSLTPQSRVPRNLRTTAAGSAKAGIAGVYAPGNDANSGRQVFLKAHVFSSHTGDSRLSLPLSRDVKRPFTAVGGIQKVPAGTRPRGNAGLKTAQNGHLRKKQRRDLTSTGQIPETSSVLLPAMENWTREVDTTQSEKTSPEYKVLQKVVVWPASLKSRPTTAPIKPRSDSTFSSPAHVLPDIPANLSSPQTQAKARRLRRSRYAGSGPALPVNVLSDSVTLQKISSYGADMLNHLQREREEYVLQELELREQLHDGVDKERDNLPLTFLFQHASSASYVTERAIENISRIIHRILAAKIAGAFDKWCDFVDRSRTKELEERILRQEQSGGASNVAKIMTRLVYRAMSAGMSRWKFFLRKMKHLDRSRAVMVIQRAWRQYTGWWNAIRAQRNKRRNENKRTALCMRLVLFEWLSKRRMVQLLENRRREILERNAATCIQRAVLAYLAWKHVQDDIKQRRAEACLRRLLNRRRNMAFNSWSAYSTRMKRCKLMMQRAFAEEKKLRFILWMNFTEDKIRARNCENAAAKFLKRMLNQKMAQAYASWWAYADQQMNLKRMMHRALCGTLQMRFDVWVDFAHETKMSRLGEQERKVREALLKMRHRNLAAVWHTFCNNVEEAREAAANARACLARMLNRRLAAAYTSWAAYTNRMKNVRRMCRRALFDDLRERFGRWADWAVGEIIARRRENERKVRNALMRMMMRTMARCFDAVHINAVQNIGVRTMLKRALGHEKFRRFEQWKLFYSECQQANNRAQKWFLKWWNKERARAFESWRMYATRSLQVKRHALRAIMGKRVRLVKAWHAYAVRCRVYKTQTKLNDAVERCGTFGIAGLDDHPDLKQDAFDLLNRSPGDVSKVENFIMLRALKKIVENFELNERMALRVQCSWRCKQGRLSLFLAKKARAERLREEEEERKRMIKAARMVQTAYRKRMGKLRFRELVLKRKKELLKKQYLIERQAKEARERWEHDQREMLYRAKVMKEVEEAKQKQEEEWKNEQERVGKAWEKIPVVELGAERTIKDLEEGEYYWYNSVTEESRWSKPDNYISTEPPPPPPTEEQIMKAWEVVQDENSGEQYFHNALTEETRWDPPEGFKVPPPKGKCSECREQSAVRHCKTCDAPFCVDCYLKCHSTAATRGHLFRVLKKATPDPFTCCKCNENLATHATPDYKRAFCTSCFEEWYDYDELLQELGFVHFNENSAVCSQCTTRLAEISCQQCDDLYCGDCSEKLHRTGRKKTHTLTEVLPFHRDELEEGEAYCVECEHTKAGLVCEQCGDAYCQRCFKRTHKSGRRSQHTTITWEEAQSPWEEFWDADEGRTVYYNTKTRERTFEKPVALMWGKEKMAWQEQADTSKQEMEEAMVQMEQMRRQMAEMQDKMAGMSKKKPSRIWKAFKKVAKAVAPSIALDKAEKEKREKEDEEFLANYDHTKGGGSPGDAARARRIRNKMRKKAGNKRKTKSLFRKILTGPGSFMKNPRGFLDGHKQDQHGMDEKYLRRMLIGKQKVEVEKGASAEKRKDAELAAYESSMMSYLAKARAEGRESQFRREVKNVKKMREEEIAKEKAEKKKKSKFR